MNWEVLLEAAPEIDWVQDEGVMCWEMGHKNMHPWHLV